MSLPPYIIQHLVTDEEKGALCWYADDDKEKALAHAQTINGYITAYRFYMDEDGGEVTWDFTREEERQ